MRTRVRDAPPRRKFAAVGSGAAPTANWYPEEVRRVLKPSVAVLGTLLCGAACTKRATPLAAAPHATGGQPVVGASGHANDVVPGPLSPPLPAPVPTWWSGQESPSPQVLPPPVLPPPAPPSSPGGGVPTLIAAPSPRPSSRAARASHVIIISEDGLRPDALIKANGSVHEAIMRQGAYTLTARTIRHASTLPSHAAMLSGFDEGAHGLSWNGWKPERGFILVPTVFDAAERSGNGSAAFVGKKKLEHITRPGSVDVFSRPGYLCKKVVEEATRYFIQKRPALEFIHFSDPDERGHAIGWMSDPQIEAIRHTDRCLATVLAAVRQAGVEDTTLFILSSDHGGHGRNHSGRTEEDRLIPWIAWGVGVRQGHRIISSVSTMDTAATALWALGYPAPPGMEGRPVVEAFAAP